VDNAWPRDVRSTGSPRGSCRIKVGAEGNVRLVHRKEASGRRNKRRLLSFMLAPEVKPGTQYAATLSRSRRFVGSWRLSRNLLLDQSISGCGPNSDVPRRPLLRRCWARSGHPTKGQKWRLTHRIRAWTRPLPRRSDTFGSYPGHRAGGRLHRRSASCSTIFQSIPS
jgi:hypothetical protein